MGLVLPVVEYGGEPMNHSRRCGVFLVLFIAVFATAPVYAKAPEDVYSALRPGLGWEPTAILDPLDVSPVPESRPLSRTALFRFIDRLPLRPASIGPEPRLPYERAPALGLLFYVALN